MRNLFLAALLTSCSAASPPPPAPVPIPPLPPLPAHAPAKRLPVPPAPPAAVALLSDPPPPQLDPIAPIPDLTEPPPTVKTLNASEIIAASDQALSDARGYVDWDNSKPANIARLATLTGDMIVALKALRAGQGPGGYAAADVVSARGALLALRSFLNFKGD